MQVRTPPENAAEKFVEGPAIHPLPAPVHQCCYVASRDGNDLPIASAIKGGEMKIRMRSPATLVRSSWTAAMLLVAAVSRTDVTPTPRTGAEPPVEQFAPPNEALRALSGPKSPSLP